MKSNVEEPPTFRKRPFWVASKSIACFTICVALVAGSLLDSRTQAEPAIPLQQDAEADRLPKPFSHDSHVADAWWESGKDGKSFQEMEQDCRGCHLAEDGVTGKMLTPKKEDCDHCHITGFREYQGELSLRTELDAGRAFRHGEHGSVDCAHCHHPNSLGQTTTERRLIVPNVEEVTYCASCHAPDSQGFGKQTGPTLMEVLNKGLSKRKLGGGQHFSHTTHVALFGEPSGDSAASCLECHEATISDSEDAAWIPTPNTKNCATECHSGVDFRLEILERESPFKGTFRHSDHVDPGKASLDCRLCHEPDKEGNGSYAVPSQNGFGTGDYQQCAGCHGDLQANKNAPLVKSHNTPLFADCASCHGIQAQGNTAWNEFEAPIGADQRLAALRQAFTLAPGSHAAWNEGEERNVCSECHRTGDVTALRLKGHQSFSHATHVSQSDPKAAARSCVQCHGEFDSGPTVANLWPDPLVAPIDTSCASCHLGGIKNAPNTEQAPTHPAFQHADHLGKTIVGKDGNASALNCVDCHQQGESPNGPMELKLVAKDCATCHGHTDALAPVPNETHLDSGDIQDCQRCHTDGYPRPKQPSMLAGLRLKENLGPAVHNPKELDCIKCHINWESAFEAPDKEVAWRWEKPSQLQSRRNEMQTTTRGLLVPKTPHLTDSAQARGLRRAALAAAGFTKLKGPSAQFSFIEGRDAYSQTGTHCLHCHWNSIERLPKGQPQIFDVNEITMRSSTTFQRKDLTGQAGPGTAPWRIGLPALKRIQDGE